MIVKFFYHMGWRIEIHDVLKSTNDFCVKKAEHKKENRFVVIAQKQTNGRGSRGRLWEDRVGNLAMSIVYKDFFYPSDFFMWPYLTAVSLHDAISDELKWLGNKLYLKWPNDILIEKNKIAGILIERGFSAISLPWIVLGIGVNIGEAPNIVGHAATCLKKWGAVLTAEFLALKIVEKINFWIHCYRVHGFSAIRQYWLDHTVPVGYEFKLVLPHKDMGIVQLHDLTMDGRLVVKKDGKLIFTSVGDIFTLE